GEATGRLASGTPSARMPTATAAGHTPPALTAKSKRPRPSVTCDTSAARTFPGAPLPPHRTTVGQVEKRRVTKDDATGFEAASRTTPAKWMSPDGHTMRQGGTVDCAALGTAAWTTGTNDTRARGHRAHQRRNG